MPRARLDHDSEGSWLLTNDSKLQARLTQPEKTRQDLGAGGRRAERGETGRPARRCGTQ